MGFFDFSWMTSADAWATLAALSLMEIVLGVDNIVFISILTGKLPDEAKNRDTVFHPIICRHPVTQRPAIYANPLQTTRVLDVGDAESEDILETLFEAIHLAGTTGGHWEHEWQVADTIIWENRGGVFHSGRMDYPLDERRIMIRCTIGGGPIEMYAAA